jgi:hypothetical protein
MREEMGWGRCTHTLSLSLFVLFVIVNKEAMRYMHIPSTSMCYVL